MTNPHANTPALQQVTVLEATWSDCPAEVVEEISESLWADNELGNDDYYYAWSGDPDEQERYPVIAAYLAEKNVKECLIHFWW